MKRIIYLLSLLALVFSCSKMEDGKSQGNYEMSDRVVANSPEVAPGTKTNVTGASVTWAAEDKIAIMGSVNCETEYVYKLENGANTKKAVFINEAEACPDENGLLAVYPSSMAYIYSGNKYNACSSYHYINSINCNRINKEVKLVAHFCSKKRLTLCRIAHCYHTGFFRI